MSTLRESLAARPSLPTADPLVARELRSGDLRARAWRRTAHLLRRLGLLAATIIPVAFFSSLICYGLLYLSPVNAAAEILGASGQSGAVEKAEIHRLAVQLGSNRPFFAQYFSWLGGALHGQLGTSYFTRLPVGSSIMQRLPVDLTIGGLALLFAVVLGFGAGIIAGWYRGGILDRLITVFSAAALTMPAFWVGILLVILFAVQLRVLPATGYVAPSDFGSWFTHALLPAVSLSLVPAAGIARQVRTSLVGVLAENYIVGARVRGLSNRSILFRHALRNAAGPAVTVIGMVIPLLVGEAIIAEQVFGLPGIGQFALQAAQEKDMPVIQGVLLVLIAVVLACNIVVDLALGWLRPETKQ